MIWGRFMNNLSPGYRNKSTSTFGAAVLAGLAISASPAIEPYPLGSVVAAESAYLPRPALSNNGNITKVRSRHSRAAKNMPALSLEEASGNFTKKLLTESEPLGNEFAKVLEENFLDLLMT